MAARPAAALGMGASASLRIPWWRCRASSELRAGSVRSCGTSSPFHRHTHTFSSSYSSIHPALPLSRQAWSCSSAQPWAVPLLSGSSSPYGMGALPVRGTRGVCTSPISLAKKIRHAGRVAKPPSKKGSSEATAQRRRPEEPVGAKAEDAPPTRPPIEASQEPLSPPPERIPEADEDRLSAVYLSSGGRRKRNRQGEDGDKMVFMDKEALYEAASLYGGKDWKADVKLGRLFLAASGVVLGVAIWAPKESAAYSQHLSDLSAASSRLALAADAIWRRLTLDSNDASRDRAVLDRVMRTEIADKLGKAYRKLMSSWLVFVTPESIQERISRTFLDIGDW